MSPEYVVWSRRPSNPFSAPAIIISSRACPPEDVLKNALALPSPDSDSTSPVLPSPGSTPPTSPVFTNSEQPATPKVLPSPGSESTPPTSPVFTNTSISEQPATPKVLPSPGSESTPPTSTLASPVSTNTSISEQERVPATPKPSWASLFHSDPSKPNFLPTSAITGFSIPAPPTVPVQPQLLALLTSPTSSHSLLKIHPRGIVNTGNLCFANAVLQVLIYCPPFWRLFHDLAAFIDTPSDADSNTPLVDATVRFLKDFIPPERKGKRIDRYVDDQDDSMSSFIPTYVYDALREKKRFDHMRGGHQEDAEEFLGFYLDTLEEELLSITSSLTPKTESSTQPQNGHAGTHEEGQWLQVGKRNRMAVTRTAQSTESPITRMFGGKFRSTLRVPHQKDSVLVEDWRSLQLDIQASALSSREQIHTIKDALAHISSPQPVQVTSVTRPGATLDATQTVHIESLPPILVLHLKRFLYDAKAGGVAKVAKQVSFEPELDIPIEIMAPGKKLYGTRFKLFGVLYHHGLSASGGHYTIDVLHPNIDNATGTTAKPREGWIRIDDELVSDVRPEDVFGTPERDDRCAYLLFYRRVGAVGSRS